MKWAERIDDRSIWTVYKGTVCLSVAYGMALSLIAIYLDANGFTKGDIGSLALVFGLGIVSVSLVMDRLIKRFSARATLVASFLGYAATVAAFPFLDDFVLLSIDRFLDGAFSVGIWVSAETILLSRASHGNKAFTMSLYAVAMGFGYVVGPGIAWALTRFGPLSLGFVGAGVVSAIAGLYVWFFLESDAPVHSERIPLQALEAAASETSHAPKTSVLWRIKNSCFATFAYGYFQASVVLFLPLFLMQDKGVTEGQTIWIPAFFAFGMLLCTNPVGMLGDRIGHLRTMRGLAIIGTVMVVGFVFIRDYPFMCLGVLVVGATLASISPVSLALQGVSVAPEEYSRATSIYNTFYALGMLIGPKVSAVIFEQYGGAAMLYHLAALWVAFIAFSVVFHADDPASRRAEASQTQRAVDVGGSAA
ncbi:MAG: MFS transporter [Myxococcota bacterium]